MSRFAGSRADPPIARPRTVLAATVVAVLAADLGANPESRADARIPVCLAACSHESSSFFCPPTYQAGLLRSLTALSQHGSLMYYRWAFSNGMSVAALSSAEPLSTLGDQTTATGLVPEPPAGQVPETFELAPGTTINVPWWSGETVLRLLSFRANLRDRGEGESATVSRPLILESEFDPVPESGVLLLTLAEDRAPNGSAPATSPAAPDDRDRAADVRPTTGLPSPLRILAIVLASAAILAYGRRTFVR